MSRQEQNSGWQGIAADALNAALDGGGHMARAANDRIDRDSAAAAFEDEYGRLVLPTRQKAWGSAIGALVSYGKPLSELYGRNEGRYALSTGLLVVGEPEYTGSDGVVSAIRVSIDQCYGISGALRAVEKAQKNKGERAIASACAAVDNLPFKHLSLAAFTLSNSSLLLPRGIDMREVRSPRSSSQELLLKSPDVACWSAPLGVFLDPLPGNRTNMVRPGMPSYEAQPEMTPMDSIAYAIELGLTQTQNTRTLLMMLGSVTGAVCQLDFAKAHRQV